MLCALVTEAALREGCRPGRRHSDYQRTHVATLELQDRSRVCRNGIDILANQCIATYLPFAKRSHAGDFVRDHTHEKLSAIWCQGESHEPPGARIGDRATGGSYAQVETYPTSARYEEPGDVSSVCSPRFDHPRLFHGQCSSASHGGMAEPTEPCGQVSSSMRVLECAERRAGPYCRSLTRSMWCAGAARHSHSCTYPGRGRKCDAPH